MEVPLSIVFVLFSLFYFTTLRTALKSYNKVRLELDMSKNTGFSYLLKLQSKQTNNYILISNLGYYSTLIYILTRQFKLFLELHSSPIYLIFIALGFIVFLILNELVFQSIGKIFANKIIIILIIPNSIFYLVLIPLIKTISLLHLIITRYLFRIKNNQEVDHIDKEDLNEFVADNQPNKEIHIDNPSEVKIFQNALEFSNVKLRECMTPRPEIIGFDINDKSDSLNKTFIDSGYSKIIIYNDTIDEVVGYLHSKDLFKIDLIIKSQIRDIHIFPETMPANKLLAEFIKTGQSIALVVDEFGGTSGIVTIEDILEEIFGEIEDEYDVEQHYEKQLSNNEFLLSARLEIDYLNEKYDLSIPESPDYETLAGFVIFNTESIPTSKEIIEIDPFHLQIIKASETKIELIKLIRN